MGRFGETYLLAGRGGRNLEGAIMLELVKPGLNMTEDAELRGGGGLLCGLVVEDMFKHV